MPDPGTNRGSLPAFAIVVAVILGVIVLVLVIFLFINRKEGERDLSIYSRSLLKIIVGSYTRLLHRRKHAADSMSKPVFPPDESNPRRPPNIPPRAQPTAYNPPRPNILSGPPQSTRTYPEESERLLTTHTPQASVPRPLELTPQPQRPHANSGFDSSYRSSRDARQPSGTIGPSLYPTTISAAGGYAR